MKKTFYLLLLITLSMNSSGQYITLKGRQFYDQNGSPFFPMVMNYIADVVCDSNPIPTTFKVIRDAKYGTTTALLEPASRYNWANCELSIGDDFDKLKQMGFNAVRFLLAPNRNDTLIQPGGFNKKANKFTTYSPDSLNGGLSVPPQITLKMGPNTTNPYNCTGCDAETFLNLVARVLDTAQAHDMKVIFLCADHSGSAYPEMGSDDADASDYASYLSALATVVKNKPALLAYDIYNEPNFMWYTTTKTMNKNKQTVCTYISEWYDSLKASDPNHLITIGGTDYGDVFGWDEGVMKLDFVSMHLYPSPDGVFTPNDTRETEKIVNLIKWCSNALQKPWIIGETGFVSSNQSCLLPWLWGNDTDQYNYIAAILPAVHNCGGSGFSWWHFQDAHYACVPDTLCNPTCSHCTDWPFSPGATRGWCGYDLNPADSGTYGTQTAASILSADSAITGCYFGLLRYGDPDSTGHYDSTVVDKYAVQFTKVFNPTAFDTCPAPTAYYYQPYHFTTGNFNPEIIGTITDASTGASLQNAVIGGKANVPQPFPKRPTPKNFYTFSDSSGVYYLIPPPSPVFGTNDSVTGISFAGVGAQAVFPRIPTNLHLDISLLKATLNYDDTVSGITVDSGVTQNFKGWNSLTLSSVTIKSGATSDITARHEIHIVPGPSGSTEISGEVHIFISETFPDCPDFADFRLSNPYTNSSSSANKEIEVDFRKPSAINSLSVIPNPSNGLFLVQLNSKDANAFIQYIAIYDLTGKMVYTNSINKISANIDLSGLSRGLYFIKANDVNQNYYQKIILQ